MSPLTVRFLAIICSILIACAIVEPSFNPPPTESAYTDSRPLTPLLLDHLISNLYEEYRHQADGDLLSDQVRSTIRQKVGDFAREFQTRRPSSSAATTTNNQQRIKRDAYGYRAALVDSSAYTLSGFTENGTIPIDFPRDLCLFDINNVLYAAALHQPAENVHNQTYLKVFRNFGTLDAMRLHEVFNYTVQSALAMDCIGMSTVGYIALACAVPDEAAAGHTGPIVSVTDGSPVFQLSAVPGGNETRVETVQYFNEQHLNRVYLRPLGPELYFFQSFFSDPKSGQRPDANTNTNCLVYKWSGYHFDLIDQLPCTNAMQVQPFFVKSDMFMAIANYRDENDNIDTFSVIYKYSVEHSKYIQQQKLRSHAAVDIQYFELAEAGKIERFLVVANSYAQHNGEDNPTTSAASNDSETHSIIYKYVNDYFTPFQSILLYDVVQFLPILGARGEFSLMIACANQPTTVWQYNGWNFEQSAVQFTGGALGSGVQRMRHYRLRSGTAIVVANTHMLQHTTNVYMPLYAVRTSGAFVSSSQDWCAEAMDEIGTQPVDRILDSVRAQLPSRVDGTVVAESIGFQQVRGRRLTVRALKTKKAAMDAEMVQRLREADETVRRMSARLDRLERRQNGGRSSNVTRVKVQQNAADGVSSASEVTLTQIEPNAEEAIADMHVNELTIGSTLNDRPIERMVYTNRPLQVERLRAKQVYVKTKAVYNNLLSKSHGHEIQVTAAQTHRRPPAQEPTSVESLNVDALTVDGLINGLDLRTLAKYALRITGDQELVAQFNINELRARNSHVERAIVSRRKLQDLIRIDAAAPENPAVQQAVRFMQPVRIEQLFVAGRLNNLAVQEGRFDALLRNSAEEQRIVGHKHFEAVRLRNPIVLQGKLAVNSEGDASKMNPIVAVTNDIVLQGDYVIGGNVTIRRALRVNDLLGKSGTLEVRRLMEDGLPLTATQVDQAMEFVQPIRTGELTADVINGVDVHQLVQPGVIQEITGEKRFTGDLRITDGFCDVLTVNGVQMQRLNETVLKKSGDQTLSGTIRLRGVQVNGEHTVREHRLLGRRFTEFLNRKDQIVEANVTISGDLLVRNAAQVQSLRSNGLIDNMDVPAMLADTIFVGESGAQKITADRTTFQANVTFGRLHVDGSVFGLGTWKQLLDNLRRWDEQIEQTGAQRFDSTIRVDDLQVAGVINGMWATDFGKLWMLSDDTEQNFTAPQSVLGVVADSVDTADGLLNGVDVRQLHDNCVMLNDNVNVPLARFESVVLRQPLQVAGTVAGIQFPADVITKHASAAQEWPALQQIAGNLHVLGRLDVRQTLNGVRLDRMCDMAASTQESQFALHVLGSAEFGAEPKVAQLNGVDVAEMLRTSWLCNENAELTGSGGGYVAQAEVTNGIGLGGLLNGKLVQELRDKYVSISRPQVVYTHVIFGGNNVLVTDELEVAEILQGPAGLLRDIRQPDNGINIADFCANALRNGVDQVITGEWQIYEAVLHDNLQGTINNLDFRTDLLRYSLPEQQISAPKRFEHVQVQNLVCQNGALLQNVDAADWVSKAVLAVGNNYTIQGTTIVENATIFGDVRVFGNVNGRVFGADAILLKSAAQDLPGSVQIQSQASPTAGNNNLIRPLAINEGTFNIVNGRPLNEFLQNIVTVDGPAPKTTASVRFAQAPVVERFYSPGEWNGVSVPGLVNEWQANEAAASNYTAVLGAAHQLSMALVESLQSRPRHLTAFRHVQSLDDGFFRQLTAIQYSTASNAVRTVYAAIVQPSVNNNTGALVKFFRWNTADSQLQLDAEHRALKPVRMQLVDVSVVRLYDRDYLIVECGDQNNDNGNDRAASGSNTKLTYLTYLRRKFRIVYESYHNATQNVIEVHLAERSCIGFYTEFTGTEVRIECALFSDRGDMRMVLADRLRQPGGVGIVQAVFRREGAEVVVLDGQGALNVWRRVAGEQPGVVSFVLVQTMRPLHLSRTVSVTSYRGAMWMATCAAYQQNATHLGSVDVYRSSNGTYDHIQTIALDVPVQVEISTVAASGELVLYALTESHLRPFVVYKYTGVTQFRAFFVAGTLPIGRQFRILRPLPVVMNGTELIAMLGADQRVHLIESVLQ